MAKAASEPLKVLLTGSAGFIGKSAARHLTEAGHEVIPFDVNGEEHRDLVNPHAFEGLEYDAVVHLGAVSSTPWARKHPEEAYLSNVMGTYNMLWDALQKGAKRVILASSSRVNELPLDNPYVITKVLAENLALEFMDQHSSRISIACLRFGSIYGPQNFAKKHSPNILNQIVESAVTGKKVDIFGDGNQERDFLFVEDVAKSLCELVDKSMWEHTRMMGLGSGRTYSLRAIIEFVTNIVGNAPHVAYTGEYPPDYMKMQWIRTNYLDGIETTPIEEGIKACMEWFSQVDSTHVCDLLQATAAKPSSL